MNVKMSDTKQIKRKISTDLLEIKLNPKLLDFLSKSKTGSIRLIKVIINEKKELELSKYKETSSQEWKEDYEDFIMDSIEPNRPCFLFYRLDEKAKSQFQWLFISWAPDCVSNKERTIYALTKSFLINKFNAGQIKETLFATDIGELSLDCYFSSKMNCSNEFKHSLVDENDNNLLKEDSIAEIENLKIELPSSPLTNREEELEMLRQSENQTRINVDTKHKTLQGVMFPMDNQSIEKIEWFKREKLDYVQLFIDINNEEIKLDKYKDHLSIDSIKNEIPNDKGRFHLFRFTHEFDGEKFKSIIFIYSMPGFVCTVKERMLYSSCKSELLQYLKNQSNLEISKTFEISESSELTHQSLIEELQPKSNKLNEHPYSKESRFNFKFLNGKLILMITCSVLVLSIYLYRKS